MAGAYFNHVKLGQYTVSCIEKLHFAHTSDFRFQLGGAKIFLRKFFLYSIAS